MGIFRKEGSVELVKILVKESSQSNHLSPGPPFPRAKALPANRDKWNNRGTLEQTSKPSLQSCKMATYHLGFEDEER